jgi:hypothetical protein
MHIVDDALAESRDRIAEEVEANGDVLFCCAEGEGLQKDDGDTDDAKEGSHRGMAQVATWV